jgi:hypothetical protein
MIREKFLEGSGPWARSRSQFREPLRLLNSDIDTLAIFIAAARIVSFENTEILRYHEHLRRGRA